MIVSVIDSLKRDHFVGKRRKKRGGALFSAIDSFKEKTLCGRLVRGKEEIFQFRSGAGFFPPFFLRNST